MALKSSRKRITPNLSRINIDVKLVCRGCKKREQIEAFQKLLGVSNRRMK